MEISNREVAALCWFFVFVYWAYMKTDASKYVINIIKIILSKRVLSVILVLFSYVLLCIYILYEVGVWQASQIKNSIIWTFSVALITIFRMNDVLKEDGYFKRTALDNLKVIVAIEFVINFHTLSIWFELLLIPVITLFAVLQAYTEVVDKEENKVVHIISTRVLVIIGLSLLVYEVTQIAINPDLFFTKSTLLDFTIPILLSLMLLPFVYFMAVYMLYSDIFLRFSILTNNYHNIKYAKFLTVKTFSVNVSMLREWSKHIYEINYQDRENIREVANAV